MPHGAYVRPLLEYPNQVVYSGRTKYAIPVSRIHGLIHRIEAFAQVSRVGFVLVASLFRRPAATKMVSGLKFVDCDTRLATLELFPLKYRRL
ncbi:hypothetical protein T265_10575 [Opisthorchis viverrini]|uniref:Uncharacterized protein n=1 Tax=Opisthorchis viverrini TaxID=6198 RepID=A0A074Z618_OPIVI|nr:hypothetical protein T265_10575 [Opisthorchis viverrini]KER20997.1 hypothetical protein T265_10575 [Opisthorchis viverrini]